MKKLGTFFLLTLIILLNACHSNKNFIAKKPTEKYMYTDSLSFERQISTINIPIDIPVQEVENQINNQLKGLIYEDDKLDDDNLMLKVWKRDSILVNAEGNVFNLIIPLKIWAKAGKFGIYKELEFSLNAKLATQLTLSPDWQLKTTSTIKGYDWISKPVFDLGLIKIPITGIVERALDDQIPNITNELDKFVGEKVELKKYIQKVWTQVQSPTLISKEYDTWLMISPVEVIMTPINGKNKRAKCTFGIKTYTETIIVEKPDQKVNSILPPLKVVNQMADEFSIGVSGEISLKNAGKLLSNLLVGQQYSFQNGKYNVTVKKIDLFGSNEKIIIAAGLEGSITGTVYFIGVPFFNNVTKSLEVKNLDYELDTKSKLLKVASWFAHGKFVKIMSESFKFPLSGQIEDAKKLIQQNLNNYKIAKGIYLNGKLNSLEPKNVYITPKSIIATLEASGKADIKIEGL